MTNGPYKENTDNGRKQSERFWVVQVTLCVEMDHLWNRNNVYIFVVSLFVLSGRSV